MNQNYIQVTYCEITRQIAVNSQTQALPYCDNKLFFRNKEDLSAWRST